MPFCQLYYHLNWATKNRLPLITPKIEPIIYNYLRFKALNLGGHVYALNGIEDHVHMVAHIPPKLSVAKFVGQIKAVTSMRFNKKHKEHPAFFWQTQYAAFSFDKKRLPYIVAYVENQKEHHRENNLIPILEKTEDNKPNHQFRENQSSYLPDYNNWFQNMAKETVS